jgi:triosephosphate isomerase (TIM)
MRKPLVAGNWKMHGSRAFIERYVATLSGECPIASVDLLLFPPACYLDSLAAAVIGLGVGIGAQNVHWQQAGALTGEIAPQMVCELGAGWVLAGHSERRAGFGETDQVVADKCAAALAVGLSPVLCLGENLAEREAGSAEAVVLRQLDAVTDRLGVDGSAGLCVAYEPVWAIGTGRTATPEQAQAMHAVVRERLGRLLGSRAAAIRILYGGSVTPENAADLFGQPDIDGALVGGASLVPEQLLKIVAAAASTKTVFSMKAF